MDVVDLADVEDRAQVGVVQGRRGAGLALEPLDSLRSSAGWKGTLRVTCRSSLVSMAR